MGRLPPVRRSVTQIVCFALRPEPVDRIVATSRPSGERNCGGVVRGRAARPTTRSTHVASEIVWIRPARMKLAVPSPAACGQPPVDAARLDDTQTTAARASTQAATRTARAYLG